VPILVEGILGFSLFEKQPFSPIYIVSSFSEMGSGLEVSLSHLKSYPISFITPICDNILDQLMKTCDILKRESQVLDVIRHGSNSFLAGLKPVDTSNVSQAWFQMRNRWDIHKNCSPVSPQNQNWRTTTSCGCGRDRNTACAMS